MAIGHLLVQSLMFFTSVNISSSFSMLYASLLFHSLILLLYLLFFDLLGLPFVSVHWNPLKVVFEVFRRYSVAFFPLCPILLLALYLPVYLSLNFFWSFSNKVYLKIKSLKKKKKMSRYTSLWFHATTLVLVLSSVFSCFFFLHFWCSVLQSVIRVSLCFSVVLFDFLPSMYFFYQSMPPLPCSTQPVVPHAASPMDLESVWSFFQRFSSLFPPGCLNSFLTQYPCLSSNFSLVILLNISFASWSFNFPFLILWGFFVLLHFSMDSNWLVYRYYFHVFYFDGYIPFCKFLYLIAITPSLLSELLLSCWNVWLLSHSFSLPAITLLLFHPLAQSEGPSPTGSILWNLISPQSYEI